MRVAAALLLFVALLLAVHGALHDTPTVDEFAQLPAGCALLRWGAFDHYPHNPPLAKMLMALPVVASGAAVPRPPAGEEGRRSEWTPWIYGTRFMSENATRYFGLFLRARLVMIGLFLLGGVVLALFARELFGAKAALGALALWLFCPNLQAHGRLATLDVAVSVALISAFYALYLAIVRPSRGRLALAGVLLGLAILTKFTALLSLPVVAVLVLFGLGGPFGRRIAALSALLAVVLLVVNLGYGLRGTLTRLDDYGFASRLGTALQSRLPAWLRIPLPRDFVGGLDAEKLVVERGEFGTYLRGRWSSGSMTYDLVALAVKVPVAIHLLVATAVASMLVSSRWRAPLLVEAFCWLPPAILIASFALGSSLKIGVRYLLPAFPFIFLGTSRLFAAVGRGPLRLRPVLVSACVVALVGTTLHVHPHELSYFNVIAGGPAKGHEWLIDSNLDWGQDLSEVPGYVNSHGLSAIYLLYFGHVEPELYGIRYRLPPPRPEPGTYVVSVNFAKGYEYVAPDHGRVVRATGGAPAWLKAMTPVDRIGQSLWVYRVP
jgi:Dolichyl-phosphate-mannose-protein mannosyltransferase